MKARSLISSHHMGARGLKLPLIGRHNVMNALAALAAASVWGIGADEAQEVFDKLQPADKRGEVVRFEEGFTVINDCYNSSPSALDALTRLLAATPGYRRRILATGEMRELGDPQRNCIANAAAMPRRLAKSTGCSACGANAQEFVEGCRASRSSERARAVFREFRRRREIYSGRSATRRLAAAERLARREDGERLLEAIDAKHARRPRNQRSSGWKHRRKAAAECCTTFSFMRCGRI